MHQCTPMANILNPQVFATRVKHLQNKVFLALLQHNFIVKGIRGCCDIIARRNHQLLLIKVLEDANAITQATSQELLKTASALGAAPVIIAEKATQKLKDNVVYTRHAIPVINLATLCSYLADKPLFMVSKNSGIMAEIQGAKLRELREQNDMSLGKLSRAIGVSVRMIAKYERNDAEISLQRAMKMYEMIGDQVFRRVDILSSQQRLDHPLSSDISFKYQDLGFTVTETRKVPFDVVAKKENTVILTTVGDKIYPDLNNISQAIGANDLAIVSKKKHADVPTLTKEEFLEFEKASALIKFIQEYR